MIKGSGVNYFLTQVGVTDLLQVFYSFESGNLTIPSISGASPIYSGLINGDTGVFWSKPGSGFFSGASVSIIQTGLYEDYFTNLLSFELLKTGKQLLINTLHNNSGYEVGLNDAHKLYFRSQNNGVDVYATLDTILSSKNLISVGYVTNYLELGYYNFNSQSFETQSFNMDFGQTRNDEKFIIGSGFTGYIDYFLNFNLLVSSDNLNQISSGWTHIPTGYFYEEETICTDRITGYGLTQYIITGFLGYSGQVFGGDGLNDFTGSFPTGATGYRNTGILESGYRQGALTVSECVTYTGDRTTLYDVLTGYASSFGMDKVVIINHLDNSDLVKVEKDYTPFNDIYNKKLVLINSGFYYPDFLISGNTLLTLNGISVINSGLSFSGQFIISNQFSTGDEIICDFKSGDQKFYTTGFSSLAFGYSGQQIFLNGQNLVSGNGFVVNGGALTITGGFTGISGLVFERPIALSYITGNQYIYSGTKFPKNAAIVFLNGIRQEKEEDYLEGSNHDLLKNNSFDEYDNNTLYEYEGTFWE
jgi:hypothetical protein